MRLHIIFIWGVWFAKISGIIRIGWLRPDGLYSNGCSSLSRIWNFHPAYFSSMGRKSARRFAALGLIAGECFQDQVLLTVWQIPDESRVQRPRRSPSCQAQSEVRSQRLLPHG